MKGTRMFAFLVFAADSVGHRFGSCLSIAMHSMQEQGLRTFDAVLHFAIAC